MVSHTTDAVGFLVTKMYEIIISGGIDLNSGVITAGIVAGIVGDLPSDVSDNAIHFVWERRNAVVRASGNPASFPIARLLAAISTSYVNAHSDVIDTFLQLVNEAGNPVFLGLNDFYSQVSALFGTLATGIANLADIDLWQTSGQLITFGLNAVGVNVLASDAATLVKQFQSIKLRVAVAIDNATIAANVITSDNIAITNGAPLTYLNNALAPVTTAAATTANTANLGSGLATLVIDTTAAITANATNVGTLTFTVKSSTQLAGGLPAIFSITLINTSASVAGASVGTLVLVQAGSGFIDTTAANYEISVFSPGTVTTANLLPITNYTVDSLTLGLPSAHISTYSFAMKELYKTANLTGNQLATTGQLTEPAAPEFSGANKLVALTPQQYFGSSAENSFLQLRALWKDVTPEAMVSAPGLISGANVATVYYSGFVANTYVYHAFINARLLTSFPGADVRTILTFYNAGSPAVNNFRQPHYDTLTQTQFAATSIFFGFFDMLSTLGFKAADVLHILVNQNLITFTTQIAQDFDYWFNDAPNTSAKYIPSAGSGYIATSASLIQRLAGFKTGSQLTPTNAFLKGTDKASDIYDAIFNNSKTATSLFKKIEPLKLTTANLQAAPPSNDVLYAAAVAQFVQNTLGASRGVSGAVYGFPAANYGTASDGAATIRTPVGGAPATATVAHGTANTTLPVLTLTAAGSGYSTIGSNSAFTTFATAQPVPNLYNYTYSKPNATNSVGVPDLSYEALFDQVKNPQTAIMSQVMAAVYALSNDTLPDNAINANDGPNVLVSWLAAGSDLATVPTPTSTWFTSSYLAQLQRAVADYNNVDVEEIIIAAANITPALTQTEASKLFVRLVEAEGLNIANLLALRKGPWSFSKSPVNGLIDIIKEFYDGTTAVPITKPILFYVGALLDYALVNFSAVSEAIDTFNAANKAEFLKDLIFAARNDVDRSNIISLMGTTPTAQLTVLNTILTSVPATRLSSFAYYLKSFEMVDLIGNLTVPAPMPAANTINDGAIMCNAVWAGAFNDLAGVKLLAPYVAPETLLSYTRKLTIYNSQGIANSANASSRLVFETNDVVSVYQVSSAVLSNLLVEMGIIVQL